MPDFVMPHVSSIILRSKVTGDTNDRLRITADGTILAGDGSSPPSVLSAATALFVDVKDYGAVGNYVVDDKAAIQSAIDAVHAAGGGTVFFSFGTYKITNSLFIYSNITLLGLGPGRSIIKADATMPANPMVTCAQTGGLSNMRIESLELDGIRTSRQSTLPDGHGIVIYGNTGNANTRVSISRNYIHDCPGLSCVVQNTTGITVTENEIYNGSRDGITVAYTSSDIRIANNWIHGQLDDGIAIDGGEGGAFGAPTRFAIVNNTIGPARTKDAWEAYNGSGIKVIGANNGVVSANVVDGGWTAGCTISNTQFYDTKDIVVSNNIFVNSGITNSSGAGHGIVVTAGAAGADFGIARIKIIGNQIRNSRAMGLYVASSRAGASMIDVSITDNQIYCSSLYASGRGLHMTPSFNMQDFRFERNLVADAPTYGVYMGDDTNVLVRPTVSGNTVFNSGLQSASPGIQIFSCSDAVIVGNVSKNRFGGSTQSYGLALNNAVSNVTMYGNDFRNNTTGEFLGTTNAATFYTHVNSGADVTSNRGGLRHATGILDLAGSGTPLGVVSAPVGSTYRRTDGGAVTSFYVKESGTGNAGWVAK